MTELVEIRAFKAVDDLDTCIKFHNAHKETLSNHGLTNLSSLNDKWIWNENVYVIVCEFKNTKTIFAGIRVHIKCPDNLLPVEEALHSVNYKINEQNFDLNNSGELCAFWVSKKNIYKSGLNTIIVNSGIALSYLLGIGTLITFVSRHTLNIALDTGFEFDFNNQDSFIYPSKKYSSNILFNKLSTVLQRKNNQKKFIEDLINQPNSAKTCSINGQIVDLCFRLNNFFRIDAENCKH